MSSTESDTSTGTVKLSHAPPRISGHDTETASSETEVTEPTEKDAESEYTFKMTTVHEVPEHPASPSAFRGKARSLVGGLVSSIRSLPRAVTHSQVYDRRSAATTVTATSSYVTSGRTTYMTQTTEQHDDGPAPPKFAAPFPLPYFIAPQYALGHPHPHAHPHMLSRGVHSPLDGSAARTSKLGSESSADTEGPPGGGTRLGGLVRELTSLPWISSRVAVDYVPGESRARSMPAKTSSSWYTLTAPDTPSEISQPGQLVPEPWFPPARLSPALEVPDEEERAAAEDGQEGERIEKLKEELREKTQQLSDLRQVVEHQKAHIGQLELELKQLRKEKEETLHRRKSSMRHSVRASSIRASMRRTSIRVSRPASTFID